MKFKEYANSFQAIARLELESIKLLTEYLGHPENDLKFIHVAGTNGKGSVCAFLQEIFTSAGYKCGKYISPNMVSVCERISVDGTEISENELNDILKTVQTASDKVSEKLGGPPTQFEIWTSAAFCYFKAQNCDIVILETGLGGARDATNVIPPPLASVITRIDIDHTEYLGNTLSEIALQKAGIIKGGGITVTCPQSDEAISVLKEKSENNTFYISDTPKIHTPDGMYEVFSYNNMKNLKCGIAGLHQIENACIAIETALRLGISEEHIRKGLAKARNIGRFELVSDNLIFDGAHNPNGMKALMTGLTRYFPGKTPAFIMGCMADKDISGSLEIIKAHYPDAKFYTVRVEDNPRSATAENLCTLIRKNGFEATACTSLKDAIEKTSDNLTVICGSLYLYKDLKMIDKNLQ